MITGVLATIAASMLPVSPGTGSLLVSEQVAYASVGTGVPEFVGSTVQDFSLTSGVVNETVSGFDTTHSRGGIKGTSDTHYFEKSGFLSPTFYLNYRLGSNGSSGVTSVSNALIIYDEFGNILVNIKKATSTGANRFATLNGNPSVSSANYSGNSLNVEIELNYVPGGTSTLVIREGGVTVANLTTTGWGGYGRAARFRIYPRLMAYAPISVISEIQVGYEPLVGSRLLTLTPLTTGTYTNGSGTLSDLIDGSTSTGITTTFINGLYSWNPNTSGLITTGAVAALFINSIATLNSGTPTQITSILKATGSPKIGPFVTVSTGTKVQQKFTTDRGGNALTVANLLTSQFGFQSK